MLGITLNSEVCFAARFGLVAIRRGAVRRSSLASPGFRLRPQDFGGIGG
jgi:hypothetical protein